jgi:two-component system, sensor histidine kinase YcbA
MKFTFLKLNYYDKEKTKKLILTSACIAFASLINVTYFTQGFILTLSVILLPIFLYFNRELNPILLTACVAVVSPTFRGILLYICQSSLDQVSLFVMTDGAFYSAYGLLYYFLYWKKARVKFTGFYITTVICDFFSNILEISLLLKFTGYSYQLFQGLMAIAFLRSTISSGFIMFYRYYGCLLNKQEHEKRYRYLIFITSKVKVEIYFMEKNINDIENVMKNAYLLNKSLNEENVSDQYKKTALDIAKDVHEIKKNYVNVIKGLKEGFGNINTDEMTIGDVLNVVAEDAREYIRRKKLSIFLIVKNEFNGLVEKHYYLVSILSNFIYNSIDALEEKKKGYVQIEIQKLEGYFLIQITDNGIGIMEKDIENIFMPGFTSKYNQKTGDIYRGIGLSHAQTIVRDEFGGDILVKSQVKVGTQFDIYLKENLLLARKSGVE